MTRRAVKGLTDVVNEGDIRASLVALRNHLARELENAPPGVAIAPIAKELRNVMADLDALPAPQGVSKVDQLATARARRREAAADTKRAAAPELSGS